MRGWWRSRRVRISLTLWYIAGMVLVLGVYAISIFLFVGRNVSKSLDDRLTGDFQWAAEMGETRSDGTLAWFEGDPGDESPWLQVWDKNGRLLYRSAVAERLPISESVPLSSQPGRAILSVDAATGPFRLMSAPSSIADQPVVIQVARTEVESRRELRELKLILLLGLPLSVALAGFGGYSLACRALAPVDRMAERAHAITAERLNERLPVSNPHDELGRLATVFNETLSRLELSFEQVRGFTADVSHQLRTPLMAIRSVGEVGLRGPRDESAYCSVIESMLEEVDRLSTLVGRLLALSRAETGQSRLIVESVDLVQLCHGVANDLGVLAEESSQRILVESSGNVRANVDRAILRQALVNLVDNAIRYSGSGATIRIRVAATGEVPTIDVIDSGPGIKPELRERIFDRFVRLDRSDTQAHAGTGLGLAIARSAVQVQGGRLTLEPTTALGCTFRIRLPGAAALDAMSLSHA